MNHWWMFTDEQSSLETRGPQGRVLMTAGEQYFCFRPYCLVRKRCLPGGGAISYSEDDGKTWGPIGGKRPPCRRG